MFYAKNMDYPINSIEAFEKNIMLILPAFERKFSKLKKCFLMWTELYLQHVIILVLKSDCSYFLY